jgi:hypothetical protein
MTYESPVEGIHYIVDPTTGCWNWMRALNAAGYGAGFFGGRWMLAHRAAYQASHGLPSGQLDHLCRNRKCINPEHLEPVTPAENVRRGQNAVLSSEAAEVIRYLRANTNWTYRFIARAFGVTYQNIHLVATQQTWAPDTVAAENHVEVKPSNDNDMAPRRTA